MIFKKEDAEEPREEDTAVPMPSEQRPDTRSDSRKEREMADNGEVTVVGVGARIDGNLVSAGSLRIDGQVKGQVNADGDVSLSPQSQVEADIRAQNVSVAGRFKGNIAVKGKAHLARGGRVDGNITSKTLVVEEGGIFHGQSIMDGTAPGSSSSGQAGSQAQAAANQPQKSTTEKTEQVKVP
jgi:cytoskeletal protein CcmA (bactofilin family)